MTDIDSAVERVTQYVTETLAPETLERLPDRGRCQAFAKDIATILAALSHEKARADEAERERDRLQQILDSVVESSGRAAVGNEALEDQLETATRELTRLRTIEAAGRAALEEIIHKFGVNHTSKWCVDTAREALAVKPAGGAHD